MTAIRADAFDALLPFPDLQMGWGLDAHWGALAAERGWKVGIIDALPVRHVRPVAAEYPRDAALAEADRFLADRPYVTRDAGGRGARGVPRLMARPDEPDPRKSVLAALLANTAIAIAKFAAALISGSTSMLAESFHSVADTGNQALLLFGLKSSEKPPDEEHPFGHGKARFFWGLLVAVSLFTVGGGFSIWQGVHGLLSGEHECRR